MVERLLDADSVKFASEIPTQASPLLSLLLGYAIPIVIILVVGQWLSKKMMKSMGGNAMSFGKSNAKIYAETETGKTFADVAGQDEAKEAAGDCRLPPQPGKVCVDRCQAAQGRVARRPAGYR